MSRLERPPPPICVVSRLLPQRRVGTSGACHVRCAVHVGISRSPQCFGDIVILLLQLIFLPSVILDATERVTTLEHQMREMEEHSLLRSTKIKDLETYIDATQHNSMRLGLRLGSLDRLKIAPLLAVADTILG